jgi:hypothetical protein
MKTLLVSAAGCVGMTSCLCLGNTQKYNYCITVKITVRVFVQCSHFIPNLALSSRISMVLRNLEGATLNSLHQFAVLMCK